MSVGKFMYRPHIILYGCAMNTYTCIAGVYHCLFHSNGVSYDLESGMSMVGLPLFSYNPITVSYAIRSPWLS